MRGICCQMSRRGLFTSLDASASSLGSQTLALCILNRMIPSQVLEKVCCVSRHVACTFCNKHRPALYPDFEIQTTSIRHSIRNCVNAFCYKFIVNCCSVLTHAAITNQRERERDPVVRLDHCFIIEML